MAASLTVAALLLQPWLLAWGARDQSGLSEDLSMKRTIMRLKRRAHVGSTLDVNGALGLNGTLGRHARRARVGSTLDLNSALHLGCNKQWITVKKLGEGSFAFVYEVKLKSDRRVVGALKKLKLEKGVKKGDEAWRTAVEEFNQEKQVMEAMKGARCLNTVQLSDTDPCVDGGDSAPFQFVMPKYKTDLSDYMTSYKKKAKCFKTIFRKVVEGVNCMNNAGWVHMDIKAANVLITYPEDLTNLAGFDCKKVQVAVADYGLAYPDQKLQGIFAGNPIYHPPETFGIGHGLGLRWEAGDFVTDRKIDWCMLRILLQRMNDETGNKMLTPGSVTDSFLSEFPEIIGLPFEECRYRG